MFILSKEVIKDIIKYGENWQYDIENGDLDLAFISLFIAPIFIFLIIDAFIIDIIFSPLETIIYLKVKKIKKKEKGEQNE